MSFLEKYTEEEWRVVSYLPQGIGLLIGGAGSDSVTSSGVEMMESIKTILAGKEKFPKNNLIQEIVGDSDDFRNGLKNFKSHIDNLMSVIDDNKIKTTEQLSVIILSDCEKAIEIIRDKEEEQILNEYKNWLLYIAFKVANRSKEGSFLGFGGERFSKEERRLYKKLELILK